MYKKIAGIAMADMIFNGTLIQLILVVSTMTAIVTSIVGAVWTISVKNTYNNRRQRELKDAETMLIIGLAFTAIGAVLIPVINIY